MCALQASDRVAVLVLGGGDVGSAVAHRLFRAGLRTVLCDLPNSSTHARRGMALWRGGDALPVVDLTEEELARVIVAAEVSGLWRTGAVLGQRVDPGIVVGHIGTTPVTTPIAGVLLGLTRDGVEVAAGQKLVEVDPRATPEVFGLGERPLAVARGVCQVLGIE